MKIPRRITYSWLSARKACIEQRKVFKAEWPGGADLTEANLLRAAELGLDLDWLMAHGDQMQSYVGRVHALFARVLTLPIPTAAAVNGHAFGAGAMLAMAHDYRTMRSDRGFFCFPEVDIRIPFTPGMAALIQAKLTPQAAIASMTTGRRFGGDDAAKYGLVELAAAEDAVVPAAVELVIPVAGKDSQTMAAIKSTMFGPAIAALRGE